MKQMRSRSLHWWIVAALIPFVMLMAAALTVQSFRSQHLVEHPVWRQLLESFAAGLAQQRALHPDAPLPRSNGVLRAWYVEDGEVAADMPAYLAALEPGYYSSEGPRRLATKDSFHALVAPSGKGRLVTLVDIAELERQQNADAWFNAVWVGLIIVLFGGLVGWLHLRLVRPVRDLADRMQAIDPQVRGERLPVDYRQAEIRAIACASNAHLERVERFIEREKSLLDQASHEFRTPIAVISGAADVLERQDLPAAARPALERIRHAAGHLSEIMVALLYLSREAGRPDATDVTAMHAVLPAIVRDHEHLLDGKRLAFRIRELELAHVAVPEAMVRIAVGNLIRNAVENTSQGHVDVSLAGGRVTIRDSGSGLDVEEAARRYRDSLRAAVPMRGLGLGLFLTYRICERFGWSLRMDSVPLDGTRATLDVRASLIADVDPL